MTTPHLAPYGCWISPVSAAALAAGSIAVSDLRAAAGRLFWVESRPDEGGRQVVMRLFGGEVRQVTPADFNVRTRVHEYGGAPFLALGDALWFANFRDQRLYRQDNGGDPQPLTAEGYRYADLAPAPGGVLVGVREDHTDPANVRNAVVALSGAADDSGRVLFGTSDFVAYPRPSPDGRRLAWMAWDHPNMPWDDTTLYVADLKADAVSNVRAVAGGPGESAVEPRWGPDGTLYFLSDRSGFWNLYAWRGGETAAILPADAEFAGPLWGLGQAHYAIMDDGRIVARRANAAGHALIVVDPRSGAAKSLPVPFSQLSSIHSLDARRIALIAASAEETAAVIVVDVETGAFDLVRRPSPAGLAPEWVAKPEAITFPTAGGARAHALYYPPTSPDFAAPPGEAPPLIVQAHGGPTGQASGALRLANQYWTSRGFALVDVDYGGSAGYGRAYRQRLNAAWGIVDVEDVIAAARHLAASGRADPARIAIHGGSAGGFTVLAALTQSDVFSAGASYYGVADLGALARDTHKFESRYLDNLVGPWPAAKAIYDARSPINRLEGLRAPLIIFQGADDPVVPPNQAHMILGAVRARGQPVAYMEFAGESHGFRRAETIIACHEAELAFYGRVFGFTPAGNLPPIEIENLPSPG